MHKSLKAVIFDMDGVIADTVEFYYRANKKIADEIGVPFDRELNQKIQGLNRFKTIEIMLGDKNANYTYEEKLKLAERKNRYYLELIKDLNRSHILPGILELLKELKEKRIKTAVASSSSNAKTVLTRLGIMDCFDYIVDIAKIKKGKPNPEIFLTAAQELRVSPNCCAAIEDGEAGLKAIQEAGMFSVAVGAHLASSPAHWHVLSTKEITLKKLIERFEN
jgi:beta-phosphoglucomutase